MEDRVGHGMVVETTGSTIGLDGFVDVGSVERLPVGGRLNVIVNYVGVLIFNLGGQYCAIEDVCTHDGGPLGEGELVQGENQQACQIECPRHGARFDVRTGRALSLPAVVPIPVYAVEIDGETVKVSKRPVSLM